MAARAGQSDSVLVLAPMPTLETSTWIDAPPDAAWAVLSDLSSWNEWNPFIPAVRGPLELGSTLRITLKLGPATVPITAELSTLVPGRAFAWTGPARRALRPIASGEHFFELKVEGSGTRLLHGERFGGPVFRVPWKHLKPVLETKFASMNDALKRRIEAR